MTVTAELADGRRLEFPDGTDPAVVQKTVKSLIGPQPQPSSDLQVFANAAAKGVAAVPDALLNAPHNLFNFGKSVVGGGRIALANMGLTGETPSEAAAKSPDISETPDLARRAGEATGFIDPKVIPQGTRQKVIDVLTQGAAGGAISGGASLPKVAAGAGMGALSSGAASGTEALTGSQNAGIVAGLLAPAGAAKAFGGLKNPSKNVQLLNEEGVQMTPGQMTGGAVKRVEDALTSIPLAGDVVKAAQRRGMESFGVAGFNRALEPIGETLPSGLKGNDAIAYVQDKLGSRYDALRAKMKGSLDGPITTQTALPSTPGQPKPQTLRDELNNIRSMGGNLPPEQQAQLNRIIKNEVEDRFTSQGMASGETIKNIESKLGKMASDFSRSDNYDVRTLGGAVEETQAALRRMVERENPQHAEDLAKINQGYANFKRLQVAASSVAAKDGVFSPAQLHSAVKSQDRSKDRSKFARGDSLMQDLTGAGKDVLSSTVPDSGTATRSLVEAVGVGGMGFLSPTAAATTLGGMSLYSPAGQKVMQAILLGKQGPILRDAAKRSTIQLSGYEKENHK